jgi:hypothetical protein
MVLLVVIITVRVVVGKPGLAGLLEPGLAGLADGRTAALVLVERSDAHPIPACNGTLAPASARRASPTDEHHRLRSQWWTVTRLIPVCCAASVMARPPSISSRTAARRRTRYASAISTASRHARAPFVERPTRAE